MIEPSLDTFEQITFIFRALSRPDQFVAADAGAGRRWIVASVLRLLVAIAFGAEVCKGLVEIRKFHPGIHAGDVLLAGGDDVVVELLNAPRQQSFLDLFRKTIRVGGGDHGFARENSRSLMVSVAVARGAGEASRDDIG